MKTLIFVIFLLISMFSWNTCSMAPLKSQATFIRFMTLGVERWTTAPGTCVLPLSTSALIEFSKWEKMATTEASPRRDLATVISYLSSAAAGNSYLVKECARSRFGGGGGVSERGTWRRGRWGRWQGRCSRGGRSGRSSRTSRRSRGDYRRRWGKAWPEVERRSVAWIWYIYTYAWEGEGYVG